MHATLLFLALAAPPNLDFSTGKLTGWEGDGFVLTPFGSSYAASSADAKGKAVVHRTLLLPPTASVVTFSAAAFRPTNTLGGTLEVVLEAAAREFAPRQVRTADGWEAAPELLAPNNRRLREYRFHVEKFAGKRVRIALIDSDERPNCYIFAAGFSITTRDELNGRQFTSDMLKLQKDHGLAKMTRYDSKHFMALSNAPAADSEYRLSNCEMIYSTFFDHFRKRGFAVTPPAEKMMVAVFNTQAGFEAYLGHSLGSAVTGIYHTPSNRLVVYDYGTNKAFVENKKRFDDAAKRGATDLERERRTVTFGRHVRDHKDDTNLSTVMHEVAHQLSFNCGLLNRAGDVPVWVAEGLAVYCESTRKGAWQGIGETNPTRADTIASHLRARKELIPMRSLVGSDDWIRKAGLVEDVVLGYSQSWALFRLLMEERPRQVKSYLKMIYVRKTPDHRLSDFAEAFGDVPKLEKRYQEYLRETVRKEVADAK